MKNFIHTFQVRGNGKFPVDMLRRDCCWPVTDTDSNGIAHSMKTPNPPGVETIVNLTRVTERPWQPTEGRWSSFGWSVVEGSHRVRAA